MALSDSLDNLGEVGTILSTEFDIDESGNADFHSNRGVNLADPSSAQDAATKAYVDSLSALATKTFSNSPYSVTSTDRLIIADATSGAMSIILPTAVGISGRSITIKKIDSSNYVTITTTSAQTIDGQTSRVIIDQYESYTFVSDGSNWNIV